MNARSAEHSTRVCLLPNTAERHGKAAAESAGHAERSAERTLSRARAQPNTRSARAEHAFSRHKFQGK